MMMMAGAHCLGTVPELIHRVVVYLHELDDVMLLRGLSRTWRDVCTSDEILHGLIGGNEYLSDAYETFKRDRLRIAPDVRPTVIGWWLWNRREQWVVKSAAIVVKELDAKGTMADHAFEAYLERIRRNANEGNHTLARFACTELVVPHTVGCISQLAQGGGIIFGDDQGRVTVRPVDKAAQEDATTEVLDEHNGAVTCFLPTSKYLYTASADDTIVCWDTFRRAHALRTLLGHTDTVTALACHPTREELLVSGSLDRTVRFWNALESPRPLRTCPGHSMKITCLRTSEELVFSGGRDGIVNVWSWEGAALRNLTGHVGPIIALSLLSIPNAGKSAPPCRLVTACGGGMVRTWNGLSCRILTSAVVARSMVCMLVIDSLAFVVTGAFDGTVVVRDMGSDQTACLTGHTRAVRCLAATNNFLFSGSDDKTVAIWDTSEIQAAVVRTGSGGGPRPPKKRVVGPTIRPMGTLQHRDYLRALHLYVKSATGRLAYILTSTEDRRCHVWTAATGRDNAADPSAVFMSDYTRAMRDAQEGKRKPTPKRGTSKGPAGGGGVGSGGRAGTSTPTGAAASGSSSPTSTAPPVVAGTAPSPSSSSSGSSIRRTTGVTTKAKPKPLGVGKGLPRRPTPPTKKGGSGGRGTK